MILRYGRIVEIERSRRLVGHRARISWVGTVGDFGRVGEPVPIVVGIGVVLDAVLVEILYHICDGYGEVFLYLRIVLVANFCSDGEGRVGLEVKDRCRSEGSVSVDDEQVVGIRSIHQSEGKGGVRIRIGGVQFPHDRSRRLILCDGERRGGIQIGGWGIRNGAGIAWVGTVGDFFGVGETVVVVVFIDAIGQTVAVGVGMLRPVVARSSPIGIRGKGRVDQAFVGVGEGVGILEYVLPVRNCRDIPVSDGLIERSGTLEHLRHGCDGGNVPVADVLIECRGGAEHVGHVRDGGRIPVANVLVEVRGAGEHEFHLEYGTCIPTSNILVECRSR